MSARTRVKIDNEHASAAQLAISRRRQIRLGRRFISRWEDASIRIRKVAASIEIDRRRDGG